MEISGRYYTRRRFLGATAASAVAAAIGRSDPRGFASQNEAAGAEGPGKPAVRVAGKPGNRKMILSFYCDDTGPHVAGAGAFETFLDYCARQGIAGESSVILGASGRSISRNPNEEEKAYLRQVGRAKECGIDSHMELMTHQGLFDFDTDRQRQGASHEGLWLYEPGITVEEYYRYFAGVIAEGQRAAVKFTGLTWPGCGCETCTRRYAELRAGGPRRFASQNEAAGANPAMWQALLKLAKEGKFRGRTVPCFFDSSENEGAIHRKASDGAFGVYDLMPNAGDHFGIWENNPKRVNPDYYITQDGKSGILVRHIQAGAPYCIWYAHWQGLNPAKGVGWPAFVTVVERIKKHLSDRVVWMRPSEITDRYHAAEVPPDGEARWSFLENV